MAAYGIPEIDIAAVLAVDPKTLRKHYREELDLGETKANAQVAGFLFNAARNGNVTAQIFWLKTRARWRETPVELRHSGAIGRKDMHELSDEELLAIIHSGGGPMPEFHTQRLIDAKARFLNLNAGPAIEEAAEPA
jgi:hypothetical protein